MMFPNISWRQFSEGLSILAGDKQLLPSNSCLVENEAIVDWGKVGEDGQFIAEPLG